MGFNSGFKGLNSSFSVERHTHSNGMMIV